MAKLVRACFFVFVVSLALAGHGSAAGSRRVAITLDDLPWAEIAHTPDALARARSDALVAALRGTHATGFVNEDQLERGDSRVPARVAILESWLDSGLALGNHAYGHPGLHATGIADYERAILDGERVLRPMLRARGQAPEWFRHPYLHAGRDDAVRDRLARFLAAHGYRIAPVTIDNGDWIYARAYRRAMARRDELLQRSLERDFVDYIDAKFAFYERASKHLFGREIPQVLLLHANALNARVMPALLDRLRRRGYRFIPLAEAVADPAYATPDAYRGPAGISWLHRWAITQSMPPSFFEGEPMVGQEVLDLAGVRAE
jgi:peptidoglycan/xylan/chitin deacetylase (PgdA/CDA1 family)